MNEVHLEEAVRINSKIEEGVQQLQLEEQIIETSQSALPILQIWKEVSETATQALLKENKL